MADLDGQKPGRRERRDGQDVRRLIVEAARDLFNERGYAGTTTRAIADRAGAGEPLIFRYFGSKSGLFREAVVAPLSVFIREYALESQEPDAEDSLSRARLFTRRLMDLLDTHKGLFVALIMANQYDPETIPSLKDIPEIDTYFAAATRTIRASPATLNMDSELAVRLPFGLIAALVLFDNWLLHGERRFSRDEVVEAAAQMMAYGVLGHR